MIEITAKKARGMNKGETLYPHKYPDDMYVASTSKLEEDYIRVETLEELAVLIRCGHKARMSSPKLSDPPSGIVSKNIEIVSATIIEPETYLSKLINDVDLDGDSKTKTRKEQAFLRANLLNGSTEGSCVICHKELPVDLLVAAHIKKRSICNSAEKMDFKNIAALMCKLGCDDLFEKGYIGVDTSEVVANKKKSGMPFVDTAIGKLAGNVVPNWTGSKKYYEWHKKNIAN